MNPTDYVKNAIKTESNNFPLIASRLAEPTSIRLLHAFMGIGTEAGEINDALKKALLYGKPFDRANAVEELGDLMWYIALACDALNVSLEEVMEKNIAKLKARYGDKFTAEAALNRDLATERKILEGLPTEAQVKSAVQDALDSFVGAAPTDTLKRDVVKAINDKLVTIGLREPEYSKSIKINGNQIEVVIDYGFNKFVMGIGQ